MRCRWLLVAVALGVLIVDALPLAAQPRPPRQQRQWEQTPFAVGDVQRLFDAYTLLQAQEALGLTDAQYARFVPKMKALHEARRRHQETRREILRGLARAARTGSVDEPLIRDRLKALEDQDSKGAAELRTAYQGIDEVLDLKQRARFRIFEENMEQRKIELLMRARRGRAMRNPVPEP